MDRLKKISILAVIALFAASFAFADEIGTFVSVEGKVDLLKAGRTEAVPAAADDIVSAGDIIRTKSLSKAEVKFSDDSSLKIGENSRVQIKEYNVENGKRTSGAILLERGNIRATVSKASGKNDFKIETPNAAGSVKGTDFFVAFQKSATSILVVNGKFSVANLAFPDKTVDVTAGNTTLVSADEPPQAPREYLALEKTNYETSTEPTVQKAVALDKKEAVEGYSSPGEMKAKVNAVSGSVRIRSRGSLTWHDAKVNESLSAGDTIETKDNGKIEIQLDNRNVINLKPGSQLVIQGLTEDRKSGEYQNLFESKYGKLRAKVGKLKGDSKFEVKTPTAIAAVRGTILYLDILPNLTATYFEEGNGSVSNIISGISKIVEAGKSANSDDKGNISDPLPPSDSERSQWHEGWGTEGGAEGYSPPEGVHGEVGEEGGKGDFNEIGGFVSPFDKVRNTETNGNTSTGGGGTIIPTPESNTLTAAIDGYFGYVWDGSSELNHLNPQLTGILDTEPWSGIIPTTVTGEYVRSGNDDLWRGDIEGSATDGGGILGWAGGTFHSWEGAVSSLYIDSTGHAGNIFGLIGGANIEDYLGDGYYSGTVSGSGDLFIIPYTQLSEVPDIEEGFSYGYIYAPFDGGNGYLEAGFDRSTKKFSGENWGIWRDDYYDASYWNGNGSPTWTAIGGGIYYPYNEEGGGDYELFYYEGGYGEGYFFSTYEGVEDFEEGTLRVDVVGAYLDYDKLGAYYGTILGLPDGEYLDAIGLGGFAEEPLTSSGYLYNAVYSYYGDYSGELGGLIGTTGNLWNGGPAGLVSIGYFYDYGNEPFIWSSGGDTLYSYDPYEDTYTTYDGGAFYGLTTGIGHDSQLTGSTRALYIDPDGNAGIFSGDLNGAYSNDVGMYLLEGPLNRTPMAQDIGIDPEELIYNINYGYLEAEDIYVGFYDSSGISIPITVMGEGGWGNTIFISDGETAQPWGIYDLRFGGPNPYNYPEDSTMWFSSIEGYGEFGSNDAGWSGGMVGIWKDGTILGFSRGIYISEESVAGIMKGDVYGIYDEYGEDWNGWFAENIGTFKEMGVAPYLWQFNERELIGSGSGSFDGSGSILATGIEGMETSITDQNWGVWAFRAGGTYTAPASIGETASPFRLAMAGEHIKDGGNDGYWLGTLSGDWGDGILEGDIRGVWFGLENSDGGGPSSLNAGPITGQAIGTYNDVDTTWQAAAVGDWVELAELDTSVLGFDNVALAAMVSVPITETYASLLTGSGNFAAGGAINATMDISMYANAANALNGIWAALISGNYSGSTGNSWSVNVSNGAANATLTGTQWDNGQWLANVNGTVNNATIVGQAGGTYTAPDPNTGTGSLTGVGAGTWQQPQTPQ